MTRISGRTEPDAPTAPPNPAEQRPHHDGTNSDALTASFAELTGQGGERQEAVEPGASETRLTTNMGIPVSDNQNSLRLGERGPTLLEDFVLREKIFHFDHERIPERIVHARGSGAHGVFEVTKAIPELTRAALFQKEGSRCDVFARISTVAGGAGSVDLARDIRGFAVKFYTQEGNWDLVSNNTPVFFIQDAMKFPDLVHAVKMEADRAYPQAASAHDTFWDFVSLMPETLHNVFWQMSDRTIPRSLRMIEGFGIHTFRMVNAKGRSTFVRFHWKPRLGIQSVLWDEAVKIQGADNDFHRRDLFESIAMGSFPQWDLGIQVFDADFAEKQPYDVLDATKLIPEEDVPVQLIGTMTLNRNPDNFFAETEQIAFCPANIVPGIDFTDDPLLQGRLFSYLDTQKSRLGTVNFHQIPINAPRCPMHNFNRDGMMQTQIPKGRANYEPNSLHMAGEPGGPRADPAGGFVTHADATDLGNRPTEKLRVRAERFADHYSQPRMFWRSLTAVEQGHLVSTFVFELSKVMIEHVRARMASHLLVVDEDLGRRVAKGLGIDLPAPATPARAPVDMKPSDKVSMLKQGPLPPKGRKLGILITDGADRATVEALKAAAQAAEAAVEIVSPRVGGAKMADGTHMKADKQLDGGPSVLFDAVAVVVSQAGCQELLGHKKAIDFVSDAFAHLKAIGVTAEAGPLLEKAGVVKDDFVMDASAADRIVQRLAERNWDREAKIWPAM
ncbi:MAG TPA: catalase [Paracoccus sp. (in: a-proteobacteria)]|nr:catalase [Paracoccus sp. (in: a-proteobacteria)]